MCIVKFAVMTDLHYEHIPDGLQRLESFIARATHEKVDFIIQLGDFCYPEKNNNHLLSLFNGFNRPHFHLIGNHDTDKFAKNEMMSWLGMDNDYYSFVHNGIHFIVIDANYIKLNGVYMSYNKQNFKATDGEYPFVPEEEIHWLKKEITNNLYPVVIFSHHSIENNFRNRGIVNRKTIQEIINNETLNGKKILICINGHDHTDSLEKINKTYYYTLNSMSYKWFGFKSFHFLDGIHSKYSQLEDIVFNKNALSAIIQINEDYEIEIQGMAGNYDDFSPNDVGITIWDGRQVTANIQSRKLVYI